MKNLSRLTLIFLVVTCHAALANTTAITLDGKSVQLKSDNTWEYSSPLVPDTRHANLSVEHVDSGDNHCRLGLKLQNNLSDKITSIVFRFSAYNNENISLDTITKGFQHIKPTHQKYKEITFSGLSCSRINYIRVHGADRCEIGKLNKFSAEKGICMNLVNIEASDEIAIIKLYQNTPQPEEDTEIEQDNIDI